MKDGNRKGTGNEPGLNMKRESMKMSKSMCWSNHTPIRKEFKNKNDNRKTK